ncbi:hypothetical protein TEA_008615 [Camellia sinensis var. sinensis]|uniref:Elp3/MiaA/NifB-like radical SAM core domain-containing protein n=1 Tax=Camellia sinensis var. sinensis TaxID=542762 RepID=A0A4S4EAM1_CAMSN|nr:hypothetical protein TEA_008615 [Camellia sinensis var. sinensis]
MLRSTFTPLLHSIPSKPKPPNLFSHSISISLSQSPPTVRQNASPTATTTTTNTLHNLSPTSAYINLPFRRKRCHYCDLPIVALGSSSTQTNDINNDPRIFNYIHLLCREVKATNSQFNHNPPLKIVFFKGGTPSLVLPKLVSLVLETLNLKFGLCLDAEISMEMDPETFDVVKMKELMGLGVNRVSLGVQAFQDELLKACGRAHGVDEVHEAIGVVGTCGVENWSMDLISSLPHQTPQMWEESLYSPGEFPLPSETQSAEFYKTASRMLSDASYSHYEISSYCKDNFECKHNLTYWGNISFYGFSLGSTSFLGGFRFSRPKKMKEYAGYDQNLEDGVVGLSEDSFPDPKDMAMDAVMLSFRTAKGLDLKSFRKTFGTSLVHYVFKAYRPFVKSGHVVCLDRHRSLITIDRFCALLSDEEEIEETVAFIRLSDPDGFLLLNELISLAFQVIAP